MFAPFSLSIANETKETIINVPGWFRSLAEQNHFGFLTSSTENCVRLKLVSFKFDYCIYYIFNITAELPSLSW